MEPTSPPSSEEARQQQIEAATRDLAAALESPQPQAPSLPAARPLSSLTSDSDEVERLLTVIVQRMDQVARLNQEQWQSGQATMQEMRDTMELAQELIASMDEQQQHATELQDRLETSIEALIKVSQNLSEIAAALVA